CTVWTRGYARRARRGAARCAVRRAHSWLLHLSAEHRERERHHVTLPDRNRPELIELFVFCLAELELAGACEYGAALEVGDRAELQLVHGRLGFVDRGEEA